MISIKTCLALFVSVAPVAFALSGDVSAEMNLVRRASPLSDLVSPIAKRDTASRIRLAKTRAARKAKRDAAVAAANAKRSTAFTGVASTAAFATYLGTKCARDKSCVYAQVAAVLPTNGVAVCDLTSRHCAITCSANYILQSDGTCLEGATSCPSLTHGAYTLVDGTCTPQCDTTLGYTLTYSSGSATPRCTNIATSTTNCGSVGFVCPGSYNGAGTVQCTNGECNLKCPLGLFYYTTTSGKPYCA